MFSAKIISSIIHPSWSTNNRNQQIPLKITFKKEKNSYRAENPVWEPARS